MKTILFILLLIFLSSCNNVNKKSIKKDNIFLWQIKAKNSKKISYIVGSIYIKKEKTNLLDKRIEQAYKNSDYLVSSINYDSIITDDLKDLLLNNFIYEDGRTLEDDLPTDLYDKVISFGKTYKLGKNIIKLKPSFLLQVFLKYKKDELGYGNYYDTEKYFQKKAKIDKKKALELISIDDVIVFLNMPKQYVFEDLRNFFNNMETVELILKESLKLKKVADLKKFLKFKEKINISKEYRKYREQEESKIGKKVIKKLEKYLSKNNSYFIIVPPDSLMGKNGIINLLKKEDYIIKGFSL